MGDRLAMGGYQYMQAACHIAAVDGIVAPDTASIMRGVAGKIDVFA
ncbi:hypothetical protein ACGTN6_00110 [Halomonas sp. THAF12]